MVYIVRNDTHLADIYKVGQTYRSIEERLLELNRETSNPGTFEVSATFPVSDRHAAEREAHKKLKEKGLQLKNEFFKGDWELILQIVEDAQSKFELKKIVNPPLNSNEVEKMSRHILILQKCGRTTREFMKNVNINFQKKIRHRFLLSKAFLYPYRHSFFCGGCLAS